METRHFSALSRIISLVIILSVLGGMGIAHASEDVYSIRTDTRPVDSKAATTYYSVPYYTNSSPSIVSYEYISDGATDSDYFRLSNQSLANGFAMIYSRMGASATSINTAINTQGNSIYSFLQSSLGATSPILLAIQNVQRDMWHSNPDAQFQVYYYDSQGTHNAAASSIAEILGYDNLNSLYSTYNLERIYNQIYQVRGTVDGFYYQYYNNFLPHFWDSSLPYSGISVFTPNGTTNYTAPTYMRISNGQFSLTNATVDSLSDYLDIISRDLTLQSNMLFSFNTSYSQGSFDLDTAASTYSPVRSVMDSLTQGFSDLVDGLGRLTFMFASDDDIEARQDADPQIQQAQNDFLSSDSSASLSLGDMGSARSVSSDLQDTFANGVSVSSGLSYITSSNSSIFDFWRETTVLDLYNFGWDQKRGSDISDQVVDFYSDNLASLGVSFDG